MRLLFLVTALFCPSSALAAPVYFDCDYGLPEGGPRLYATLVLDEASKTVLYVPRLPSIPYGPIRPEEYQEQTVPAVFTREAVAFQETFGANTTSYVINRVDLSMGARRVGSSVRLVGTCLIAKAPPPRLKPF